MSEENINIRELLLDKDIRLPACPAIFLRLMDILRDEKAEMKDLVKIVSADAALTLEIIRVANSPFYGAARQIKSIGDAAMRLGFNDVWAIASALKSKEMFEFSKKSWTLLDTVNWEHGLRTAAAARVLAARTNPRFIEFFFTAGLLHDIGKVLLLHVDPSQYPVLCENGAVYGVALVERERETYGADHAAVGSELLVYWSLPDMLSHLVKGHHTLLPDNLPSKELGPRLLALSDEMAHCWKPSASESGLLMVERELPSPLVENANLTPEALQAVAEGYQREYKKLKELTIS